LRMVSRGFGRGMGSAAFSSGGFAGVLTIGNLGTSRRRLEYYDAQVATGAEDYYTGRGESPGRWRGAGARPFGLPVGVTGARSSVHLR
jgi:TrwC relaxase